jgi:site-specific DNA-methyltransferase (adenine-specific)
MTSRDYEFVEMPTQKNGKIHISQKPYSFIEKLVTNSSNENETVLDPFSGSGTTGLACKNTKRKYIGIEKNLESYENSIKRLQV